MVDGVKPQFERGPGGFIAQGPPIRVARNDEQLGASEV